jgi:hypothetical protein
LKHGSKRINKKEGTAMDHNLHTQLMITLLKVPLAQTYDGRTTLLAGIPGISSIQRNSGIDYADLALLINQLAGLRLTSGVWALSIFLDNAITSVSGFDLEGELKSLKQRFEASVRDTDKTEQHVNQHLSTNHLPLPFSTEQSRRTDEIGTFENKQAFAVIIGIAGYPNVSQLSDVVLKDARDIRSLLHSPEYCGYLESNVKLLPDKKATADAIRDSFGWLAKTATPESTAIIYFSGHGLRLQTDSQAIHYLLPYNYDPADMEKTAVSGEELTRLLNAIKTQRLVVIFDCCHSGGTGETKAAEPVETFKVADKEFKSGFEEQYLAQLAKGTGRIIMASSRPDEPAYILPGMDNSLFTHYLLVH